MRRAPGDRHRDDHHAAARAPLTGPVYAVSGSGGLPRLAFILNGQVSLVPRAESSSTKSGALKTVVPTVPDAPIGDFRLTLFGGKQGYLVNTRSLCAAPPVSTIEYTAQNGKTLTQKVKAKTACAAERGQKRALRAAVVAALSAEYAMLRHTALYRDIRYHRGGAKV